MTSGAHDVPFSTLVGKTIVKIDKTDDMLRFTCADGTCYLQDHSQDCCETVCIEDVVGDLADLIDVPILEAEEVVSREHPVGFKTLEEWESYTWTFYKLATAKGRVTIRWFGESSGYYSESVSFTEISHAAN